MKIGKFAQTTNTNIDTVRYYMKEKVLIVGKKGNYYDFGAEQLENMEIILALKNLDFSLSEIRYIFSSVNKIVIDSIIDHQQLKMFQSFIEEKMKEVDIRMLNIVTAQEKLNSIYLKLKSLDEKETFTL
jgi:Predicted transcriptional regulators